MSRIRHDSPDAERFALLWHQVGATISAISFVLALGGVAWHAWAIEQHKEALEEAVRSGHGGCCG